VSGFDIERAEALVAAIKAAAKARAEELQPGQCPGCGAYRLDGQPPRLHEPGCPWEADRA
jgi:hypothetical protein